MVSHQSVLLFRSMIFNCSMSKIQEIHQMALQEQDVMRPVDTTYCFKNNGLSFDFVIFSTLITTGIIIMSVYLHTTFCKLYFPYIENLIKCIAYLCSKWSYTVKTEICLSVSDYFWSIKVCGQWVWWPIKRNIVKAKRYMQNKNAKVSYRQCIAKITY